MQSVREIRLVCLSNMARRFMDGLIYDLLHKPIVKHELTRIFYHDTMTPHYAEKAYEIIKRREGLSQDFFEAYLNYCAKAGLVRKVANGIEEAASEGIKPPMDNWYGVLAQAHAYDKNLLQAVHNLTLARKLGVYDGRTHDTVVRLLCVTAKNKAYERVQKEHMMHKSGAVEHDELQREAELIDEIISQAVALSRTLRVRKVFMHNHTYQILVHVLQYRGRYEEANEMAEWAHELGYSVSVDETRFLAATARGDLQQALLYKKKLPDMTFLHYSNLLARCSEEGDLETWLPIINEVMTRFPITNSITYSKMIDILGSRGAYQRMEEVYAALVRSRQALNPLVLARMMHHQLTAGNITRTRNLLYEMYQRGFNCDVAVQMVTHLLQLKEMWAQCDELLIDLRKRNVRLTSRCDLSNCYLHMVPYWAARKETHARCVAYMLELPEHNLSIFNAWLAELAQRGDVLACINAMREMRAHNHKPNLDSYCALFHAAANAQLRGAQDSLFEGMVNDKVEPNAKLRLAMMRYFIAVRNIRACELLARDLCNAYDDATPLTEQQKGELSKVIEELQELKERTKEGQRDKGRPEEEKRVAGEDQQSTTKEESTQHQQRKKGKLKGEPRPSKGSEVLHDLINDSVT